MHQPEDKFDLEKSLQKFQNPESHQNYSSQPQATSTNDYEVHKKQIENLFKKLIIGGLIGGLVLGLGAIVLLKKLGLTEKPNKLQTDPKPATEQIRFLPNIN